MSGSQNRPDHGETRPSRAGSDREMRRDPGPAVAIVAAGTFVPLAVAARYEGFLQGLVGPVLYSTIAATGFGLATLILVDAFDLDRRTVGQALVFGPVLLAGLGVSTLSLVGLDLFSFAFNESTFFTYPIAISVGGGTAVTLSLLTDRLWDRASSLPDRRNVTIAAGTTALLGLGAGVGHLSADAWDDYTTPPDGPIAGVQLSYRRRSVHATMAVPIEDETLPFQVTVVAPDGTDATTAVTSETRTIQSSFATPTVNLFYPDDSIYRGQFEIRAESESGAVGPTTTVTVDEGPLPSIRDVETRTTGRNTRIVDFSVENEGDVAGQFGVALYDEDGTELDSDGLSVGIDSETEAQLSHTYDDREGPRDAVLTVQFEGPEADERLDRKRIRFPDQ